MKTITFTENRTNQHITLFDCEILKTKTSKDKFVITTSNKEIFETNYLLLVKEDY